jgi:hypothetical protein
VKISAILLVMLVCVSVSFSQENDSTYKYWMTLGLWADRDADVALNYSFSPGQNFFTVGYFERGGFLGGLASDGYHISAVNASIGDRIQSQWFHVSGFIGPSFIFGRKIIPGGDQESFKTIGLDLQSQFLFRVANEVGFGLALYGNLNPVKNYSGFRFMITIGNGK